MRLRLVEGRKFRSIPGWEDLDGAGACVFIGCSSRRRTAAGSSVGWGAMGQSGDYVSCLWVKPVDQVNSAEALLLFVCLYYYFQEKWVFIPHKIALQSANASSLTLSTTFFFFLRTVL